MGKGRIHLLRRARDEDGGETRQPPPGATPNRQAMTRPVELAGRWLERWSNPGPRGMTVGDRKASYRTRLTAGFPLFLPESIVRGCCPPATRFDSFNLR